MSLLNTTTVVIPSLEPDDRLAPYVDSLLESGFERIVVVDDGSSEPFQKVFRDLETRENVTVLHHDVNHGKGVALKTAYAWIAEHPGQTRAVLTADADGQHKLADCKNVLTAFEKGKPGLYLGSRDFNLPNIPPKSRFGNKTTSLVFRICNGVWLPDTQTGLRVFDIGHLDFMSQVEGERYEYEMNVLIACAREKIPMVPVTIETVYENNNEGTHFHPIRDSVRIYKVILGSFIRFMGASIFCMLVDNLAAAVFSAWLLPLLGMQDLNTRIWVSGFLARIISSILNFCLNKSFVFRFRGSTSGSAWKYGVLCVASICLSNLGVTLLTKIGMARWVAKLLCDTVLYFVNYHFQQVWVFRPERKEGSRK